MSNSEVLRATARSKVKTRPQRGLHDREIVNQILDEALVVHVGFIADNQPYVIPMGYGEMGSNFISTVPQPAECSKV